MLSRRITAPFKVVSLNDPAIGQLPLQTAKKYHTDGRNFEDLGDLSKLTKPLTVFTCLPLKTSFEPVRDQMAIAGQVAHSAWAIFAAHVTDAENLLNDDGRPLLEWTDPPDKQIKPECRDKIPSDVVMEIALVIVEKANVTTKGFTMPEQYLGTLLRYQILHAKDVDSEVLKNASRGTKSRRTGRPKKSAD